MVTGRERRARSRSRSSSRIRWSSSRRCLEREIWKKLGRRSVKRREASEQQKELKEVLRRMQS